MKLHDNVRDNADYRALTLTLTLS